MLDIKEVITILCKYLSDTVNSPLTPEYFRLAKYDKKSEEVINAFWDTLDKLTYFAVKEINDKISFTDFDKCTRTKLRLAYLQCPSTDVYCLSGINANCSTRSLLIVLAWIITKYDMLKNIVRLKLLNSSLGREFSKVMITTNRNVEHEDANLTLIKNQINNLIVKSNKLSNNLKTISELCAEKVKLMTRVHAASITTSGLPHLSVSEMSLIKKIATNKDKSDTELETIKEMEKTASMLDTHMKWLKKSHIFHTWMNTVLDEYEKDDVLNEEGIAELAKFIYLLRHLIRKRLKSYKHNDISSLDSISVQDCPSRLLRVQKCVTEAQMCLTEKVNQFDAIDNDLLKNQTDLENELKFLLGFIPNCVHI